MGRAVSRCCGKRERTWLARERAQAAVREHHGGRRATTSFASQRARGWKSKVAAGLVSGKGGFLVAGGPCPCTVPICRDFLVVVWGVSFMKVLILLTWMLPALASLFLG